MCNARFVLGAFAASLLIAGCGRGQPVQETPTPIEQPPGRTPQEIADSIAAERARQDSIRAAQLAAEQAAQRAARAARQTLEGTVYFDYDESTITSATEAALRAKVEVLRANPGVRLRMEGHADERGTSEYNIALGNERAESVIQFLTNFGLSGDRFSSVSYGEEQPAVQGSNEEAWALNRRVEFVITAGGDSIVGS
ncbi:MAG: OmpA family protein [Gemmatimonadota bacterium]|nr:OmpA family protein [Gemmatimonadota bacterium]MDE2677068.1 OmpA family protein [Gemmatimonadota bacterium]